MPSVFSHTAYFDWRKCNSTHNSWQAQMRVRIRSYTTEVYMPSLQDDHHPGHVNQNFRTAQSTSLPLYRTLSAAIGAENIA